METFAAWNNIEPNDVTIDERMVRALLLLLIPRAKLMMHDVCDDVKIFIKSTYYYNFQVFSSKFSCFLFFQHFCNVIVMNFILFVSLQAFWMFVQMATLNEFQPWRRTSLLSVILKHSRSSSHIYTRIYMYLVLDLVCNHSFSTLVSTIVIASR